MKVSLIAAMDKNRVIGKENDIPWRIPEDWEYVKNTTKGYPIILGRKNLESIGRALPGRRNIILTRDKGFSFNGCEIVHSIEDVFELCNSEEEIFIFGGEQIYNLFLPYVEKMYITKIHY
ncbi:dihydrofolate reductase, partial [Staphylococcus aureus]